MSLAQPLLSILQVLALDEERRFFWWKGVVLGEAAPQHPPSTAPGERLALAKLNAGAMRSIARSFQPRIRVLGTASESAAVPSSSSEGG